MPRTTIRATSSNYVELSYDCPMTGDRITEEFHCPRNGGYVRSGQSQVCENLASRGNTLYVGDESELLPLIRREWRKAQAAARRDRNCW